MNIGMAREADAIGAIIFAVFCFAIGVTLGAKVLVNPGCKELVDALAMLGGWASAIGTFAAAWVALRISLKQNKIATLDKKREIFIAFFELKMHMKQKSQFAEQAMVSRFHSHSINAKIYLPADLAKDIDRYYQACFWIAEANRVNGGIAKDSNSQIGKHREVEKALAPSIEDAFLKLLQETQP